ncbi:unnamed protein product [Rotaria magnacalcarata]|uniref:Cation-transporting P-type ATPase N-terminal domain-containing protein n=1 Tax=Rotaria magnacalcarata TaxID=392030 RepID=A0A816XAW5_9BILA|nr:unnamed protein product [Rotaria magnacalcarata]
MEKQNARDDKYQQLNTSSNTPSNQLSTTHDSTVELWGGIEKTHPEQDTIHMIALEKIFKRFHTNPNTGLSSDSIPDARAQYGLNRLTPPEPPNYFWLLFKQLFAGFNGILWCGGILALLAYKAFGAVHPDPSNLALGILIFIVIILNSMLNSYQEIKSIKIVAAFSKLIPTLATVRRDGREQQIITDELVPGDIILIRMGDKLPADCRFISCDGLKVNTSELTGESMPISAGIQCTSPNFMETKNIGFYSSMVEQGTGEAVVIATGDSTVLGKMSKLTRGSEGDEITGLHREVNRFILFVVLATLTGIIVLWVTWGAWLNNSHHGFIRFGQNVVNTVGLIVAFLPMGLPSAVTLVLTIVAKQMYQQRVLVKSLQIVETFNSVSVIATDKTGTLTQNKMAVTHLLWDTQCVYNVPMPQPKIEPTRTFFQRIRRLSSDALKIARRFSNGATRLARKLSSNSHPDESECVPLVDNNCEVSENLNIASEVRIQAFRDLLIGAALCNNASKQIVKDIEFGQEKVETTSKVKLVGDAADTALYHLCADQCSVDIVRVRSVNPRLKVLPFNSANKFMISANQLEASDSSVVEKDRFVLITMKGAPDMVMQRCSTYKANNDEILPLDTEVKNALAIRQEKLGKNGYRVIALCQQKLPRQQYDSMMEKYKDSQQSSTPSEAEDLSGFPSNDYCFIGLFSLLDPPRPEVPAAVLRAREAHIRIAMVTGDHPTTAKAIAKQVNILTADIAETNGVDTFKVEKSKDGKTVLNLYRNDELIQKYEPDGKNKNNSLLQNTKQITNRKLTYDNEHESQRNPWYKRIGLSILNRFSETQSEIDPTEKMAYIPYAVVVSGAEINYMDSFMWDWVLSHQELVFARTSPEQKLRIVSEFQRRAEVVAVTGDGTNDAPALKCANLGIAMQSGTEVAKEAGDMILLDNNFASIIKAIETGRLLSDNLKKVAIYLLPAGSWSQIWPVFFTYWFGMPLALPAFYATIFCMLNDVFMSLAIVAEKAEGDIMTRPPSIRSKDHILNWKLLLHAYMFVGNIECFTGFFCFCFYWIDHGVPFDSFMFTYEKFGKNPLTPYSIEQLIQMTYISQSVYYCSLCLFQFFNYFATRTRYASIIEHNPFWGKGQNLYVFIAMILSVGIQLLVTKVQWFNEIFHTAAAPVIYVLPTLGFGILWLLIDELRKLMIRKFPNSFLAKIAW